MGEGVGTRSTGTRTYLHAHLKCLYTKKMQQTYNHLILGSLLPSSAAKAQYDADDNGQGSSSALKTKQFGQDRKSSA